MFDRIADLSVSRAMQAKNKNGKQRMIPAQRRMFPDANVICDNARGTTPTLAIAARTNVGITRTNVGSLKWSHVLLNSALMFPGGQD